MVLAPALECPVRRRAGPGHWLGCGGGWLAAAAALLAAGALHRPAFPSSELPLAYPGADDVVGRAPPVRLSAAQVAEFEASQLLVVRGALPAETVARLRAVLAREPPARARGRCGHYAPPPSALHG